MPRKAKEETEEKKQDETEDGESTEETTKETKTTKTDTKTSEGKSTTTGDTSRDSEREEEREPSWLGALHDRLGKIEAMVKPKETPDGAGVKVKGANEDKTEHTIQTEEKQQQRKVQHPAGARKLSFFRRLK